MDPNAQKERRLALIESELDTMYKVSQRLSRSLDLHQSFSEILTLLHERQGIRNGMIGLTDDQSGGLRLSAMHDQGKLKDGNVLYRTGEGLVGQVMTEGEAVIAPRLGDEPLFLDRTGVYDADLPFVGVPIFSELGETVGVLAAQPPQGNDLLGERARFLEMISTMISQTLRLYKSVETERRALTDERDTLRRKVKEQHGFDRMVGGRTEAMRMVFEQVRMVSKWNTTVLIRGESGTGKELVANAIHYNSPRANGPFIKLNCAALPDQLIESELFGHEKGAFTGAVNQRKGRFEMSDGGTLFLDEIGEITAAFQAKLLRVLQEGEFERVGGAKTIKVDVRVIAATNKDLEKGVETGDFREDLYYRLNVMPIIMPPLRARMEDLPDLARHLVDRVGEKQGRPLGISEQAISVLMSHVWPGNVRELENCLERASIMAPDGEIDQHMISMTGLAGKPPTDGGVAAGGLTAPAAVASPGVTPPSSVAGSNDNAGMEGVSAKIDLNDPTLDERDRVIAALEEAGWVQAKAARLLNMTPRQIAYRIQTLEIKVRQI